MPQSHGTRRRPAEEAGTPGSGRGRRSSRKPGTRRAGRVPEPRTAPDRDAAADHRELAPFGPDEPRDPYGEPEAPGDAPEGGGRVRRVLTSNVTITVVAIGALGAALTMVDLGSFVDDATKPPKAASADLSTNDMLAKLTSASDMDKVAADAVAVAKKRAYEEHQRELKRLKEKAKRDAAARAKLKAEQERERLAKSNPSAGQNKAYGKKMNEIKGWGRCWPSLLTLWNHESGWNERAENPSSGAYGIPQALPGSKLASAGADWRTSSPTQIAWGLGYIKARYKDPCGAWAWWQAHNWY
ncbi:lytic transglycosylase domain-containing protein [Actinomadura sp. WMMA1423]|uniref:aggregation-promoting factor C-terminal-like domain-containing protein n=1 Tax=Actinomadura sp. WMMA1423 TaxID=2591108 RepID=UPI001146D945|nr:lytic transglycosylase domain-containing protein [Actinomadura sp. WMMA1423]